MIALDTYLDRFDGVGMVRAEYVMRASEEYVTLPSCQQRLSDYVEAVLERFAPRPVWLRQADLTTLEVNTLRGADRVLVEKSPLLGLRGLRRGIAFPDTMRTEIGSVLDLAHRYANLHYLFVYVGDAAEFATGRALMQEMGWPNKIGTMIEIPSAAAGIEALMQAGAENVMLGTNDMTSLLTGQQRTSDRGLKMHPSLLSLARTLRGSVPDDVRLGVAGYLPQDSVAVFREIGFDYCSIHYADVPAALDVDSAELPDLGHMQAVKTLTKTRVAQWQKRYYQEAPAEPLAQDARLLLHEATPGKSVL